MIYEENRDQMLEALRENVVYVEFTKADGSTRKMNCTLDPKYLPEQKPQDPDKPKKEPNLEIIPVWDIEADGFRSFRLDSITKFEAV